MANVAYGPLVSEVAGKVGGVVFFRSAFGTAARRWAMPKYSNSATQLDQRAELTRHAQEWFTQLDATQRLAWDTYAATCPFLNSLGQTYYLNGYGLYIRNNSIISAAGYGPVYDGPTSTGFPTSYSIANTLTHATGVLSADSTNPVIAVGDLVLFFVHQLQPVTRTYYYQPRIYSCYWDDTQVFPVDVMTYDPLPPGAAGSVSAQVSWYTFLATAEVSKMQSQLVISE